MTKQNNSIDTQEVTLENWQFALAPLSQEEQQKIQVAITGMEKLAEHVQVDERVGEIDLVADCFAQLVCAEEDRQKAVGKLLNHTFARALQEYTIKNKGA